MSVRMVLMAAASAAFAIGGCADVAQPSAAAQSDNVVVLTGRADGASDGLTIETAGWSYGGGFGFRWVDETGSIHDGGRPDCVPEGGSRMVRFAATEVTVDGSTWRPIVWLDCR
jgi:hypothetical protein